MNAGVAVADTVGPVTSSGDFSVVVVSRSGTILPRFAEAIDAAAATLAVAPPKDVELTTPRET